MPTLPSRVNHLGNGIGTVEYNEAAWTVPLNLKGKRVVFRLRYNITTLDFAQHVDTARADGVDVRNNTRGSGNALKTDVYSKFGLTAEDAEARGYVHRNNPNVSRRRGFARASCVLVGGRWELRNVCGVSVAIHRPCHR